MYAAAAIVLCQHLQKRARRLDGAASKIFVWLEGLLLDLNDRQTKLEYSITGLKQAEHGHQSEKPQVSNPDVIEHRD